MSVELPQVIALDADRRCVASAAKRADFDEAITYASQQGDAQHAQWMASIRALLADDDETLGDALARVEG
jgi:hypothetical protein